MIITFLVGSIIGLIGRIGGDMMSVISYVVSLENFNSDEPVLINKLGSANQYLNVCLNGDGNIADQLDISNSIGSFDDIYVAQRKIDEAIENFTSLLDTAITYNFYKTALDNRINYNIDENVELDDNADIRSKIEKKIFAFNVHDESKLLELSTIIQALNQFINDHGAPHDQENWSLKDGDKTKICGPGNNDDGTMTGFIKFHPSTCKPNDRDWIKDLDESTTDTVTKGIKNYAALISDMVDMINNLNGDYKDTLENLKGSYRTFLETFVSVLTDFSRTIQSITGILEEYIGTNSAQTFSFLNGQFIGKNLKIVLKYLKYSLGKDLYMVGFCLIIVGFSLIFSISLTILTIVIINIDIDQKKMFEQQEAISEFATDNDFIETKRKRRSHSRRKSRGKY